MFWIKMAYIWQHLEQRNSIEVCDWHYFMLYGKQWTTSHLGWIQDIGHFIILMEWAGHVIWQVYGIFNELYSNNDCLRQSMSLYHVFWWYQVSDHVFWSLIQNSCTLNGLQLPVLLVNLVILIIRPWILVLNSKIHVLWMNYNFQFSLWTMLVTSFTLKIPCILVITYNSYLHSLKLS